jgi:lysophospholipase L1-like esterase
MVETDKKKGRFLVVSINILAILLVLVLVEVTARLVMDPMPSPEVLRLESLQFAPSIFSRHVFPQIEVAAKGLRGRKYYINEQGYRGMPFTREKPAGVIRIMFYGGSQVFDSPADMGRDWPHRVEGLLKKAGHNQVQVINAGTPGHASFDSLGRFLSEGHVFRPDYVVLCNAWNDFKYFSSDEPLLRQFKPHDDRDDYRISYRNGVDRFLCERSLLYLHLRERYFKARKKVGEEGVEASGLSSKLTDYAVSQYRLTIETFVDMVRNAGARPVLMTQARLVAAGNTPEEQTHIGYTTVGLTPEALLEAYAVTDRIIHETAENKQVPVVEASQAMTGQKKYFFDHVHLLDEGSRELARLTAAKLEELLAAAGPADSVSGAE